MNVSGYLEDGALIGDTEQTPQNCLKKAVVYMEAQVLERDTERLQETVQALKKLPIRLSNEAMQAIRYWDGGALHE